MTMIEIIECKPDDLPELSLLWEKMISEVMLDAKPNKEWWANYIRSFMAHGDYKCFKAVDNGVAIAFIDGSLFADPSIGEIIAIGLNFYVLPEYRGIIGARLYLKLVREGKARGAKHIDLICYKKTVSLWDKFKMDSVRYVMRKAL